MLLFSKRKFRVVLYNKNAVGSITIVPIEASELVQLQSNTDETELMYALRELHTDSILDLKVGQGMEVKLSRDNPDDTGWLVRVE